MFTRKRCERGAALFDWFFGTTWINNVNESRINTFCFPDSVEGQVFGSSEDFVSATGLESPVESYRYGFGINPDHWFLVWVVVEWVQIPLLNWQWRRIVRERKNSHIHESFVIQHL